MDPVALFQQTVLFVHLVAFAVALAAVLREDVAIVKARRVDAARLAAAAATLGRALSVLWISGLVLVWFDIGLDLQALLAKPKLVAKLAVVTALTANGVALHALVLPWFRRPPSDRGPPPARALVLGAISTASWLYASFVGASRLVAPWLGLADFMLVYAGLLAGAIAIALLVLRPRMTLVRRSTAAAARGSL